MQVPTQQNKYELYVAETILPAQKTILQHKEKVAQNDSTK